MSNTTKKIDNATMDEQEAQELIREARRAYDRAYRARNREKVQKWNHDYWIRKGTAMRAEQGE